MKIELKDVIHFYLGCDVQTKIRRETTKGQPMKRLKGILKAVDLYYPDKVDIHLPDDAQYPTDTTTLYIKDLKPILRKLEDMTKIEADVVLKKYAFNNVNMPRDKTLFAINICKRLSEQSWLFVYLLKQQFDLFDLIESEQAIEKIKLL